ncbi:MAG: hypothetical protein EPO35_13245 [Acidobacteria bacterium]|nr:MAG: hypothetical protein EPO35_13245 [Acidobacteriota bacterium]
MRFLISCLAAAAVATGAAGCGAEVDLAKAVQIVDVSSGYYDMGIINGKTKLVPQAIVHVKNASDRALPGFQMSASYWAAGDDGMKDEMIVTHSVAKDLAPGATSDAIVLRANFGFTLEVPRAETFQNSSFRDFTIKVFGKVGGRIAKLGEFTVERKIVPKDAASPSKD